MEKHIKLVTFRVNEIEFKFNGAIKPDTQFRIVPKIESKLGQNGKNLFVNLSVRVNEDISSPVPFNLNVVMFGHFIAEKEAEQRVYIEEAIDTLYPFLRAAVSSFTANCNIPPYVLPIIGSSVLQESPAKADKEKENIN
ncbi:MAG: protein-export chaperone SecB [Clostridiales bacterium]|nr:protein-export chaperone SecB [Clostridiales bacterium]